MSDFNDHVLEVRYKPNPKVLDYRGSWAEAISAYMELPRWRITENRIDIYLEEGERCFVGFRNAGFVVQDTWEKNYFPEKSTKFFRYLFSLEGFGKRPYIERIGVRSKFLKSYPGEFDDLKEKYATKYLTLTDDTKKILNANLIDIGGSLNFADKFGNFNTMSGPMAQEQMLDFFKGRDELPEIGLFFDIDYWLAPKREMAEKEILPHISQFANSAWDKFDKICKLIFED